MPYEPQEREVFVIFRRGSTWLRSNRDFMVIVTERVSAPLFSDLPVDQLDEETVPLPWKLQREGNYLRGNLFPECESVC